MSQSYRSAARLSGATFAIERSQIFVSSSLLAAAGALLALVGLAWVFALALAIIIGLAARLVGGGGKGSFLLALAFFASFLMAADRLARLIPAKNDLSRSRADFVAFEGSVESCKFKEGAEGRFLTLEVACKKQLLPWPKALSGRVLVHAGPYKYFQESANKLASKSLDLAADRFVTPIWGGSYIFTGRIMRPHVRLFSFEFDEQRWLALKNIYCQLNCDPQSIVSAQSQCSGRPLGRLDASETSKSPKSLERFENPSISTFVAYVADLRDFVVRCHCQTIGDERGRVLASMVLGDRAVSLSDSLRAAFNRVGLSHLLAASGLNLTIIVGAALFIFAGAAKKNARTNIVQTLGAFVCVLFFVSLAGPSPSVTRATIMCLLLLWSGLLFRRLAKGAALAFSLWLALLLDPLSILDVGLELSYGATFGIIYIVPIFSEALPDVCNRKPWSWFSSLAAVVLAAQLTVLPVQIFYFQKLSTLVLPANILAEPLVAPITVAGFLSSLLFAMSYFCQALASLPAHSLLAAACQLCASWIDWGCGFLIDLLLALTHFLGASPISYLYLARPASHEIVVYYLTLLSAFFTALERPRCGAALALSAAAAFTLTAFLNSSFVEVLQVQTKAANRVAVFSAAGDARLFEAGERQSTSGESVHLPAFRRDFLQIYLRSLSGRGIACPLASLPLVGGTSLYEQRLPWCGQALSILRFTEGKIITSCWPAAAIDIERTQDVRLIRLKTWGLIWIFIAKLGGPSTSSLVSHPVLN